VVHRNAVQNVVMKLNRKRISLNTFRKDYSGLLANQQALVTTLHKLLRLELEAEAFAWTKRNDEWFYIWLQHANAACAIKAALRKETLIEDEYAAQIRWQPRIHSPTISKRSPWREREHKQKTKATWQEELEEDNQIKEEIFFAVRDQKELIKQKQLLRTEFDNTMQAWLEYEIRDIDPLENIRNDVESCYDERREDPNYTTESMSLV